MDITPINALIGATFGGVGVKLIDLYFTSRRTRRSESNGSQAPTSMDSALYHARKTVEALELIVKVLEGA